MVVGTSIMFIQTTLFFDGKDDISGRSTDNDKEGNDENNNADSGESGRKERPFNYHGVAMCMVIFYVHYYSFAVQETITTPMVNLVSFSFVLKLVHDCQIKTQFQPVFHTTILANEI